MWVNVWKVLRIRLVQSKCSVTVSHFYASKFRWESNQLKITKVKVKVSVAQLCLTLCDPMDCSLKGSSVHGILQGEILEWVAIPFSRGSSWPRYWTQVSCLAGRFFTVWATREENNQGEVEKEDEWGGWLFQTFFISKKQAYEAMIIKSIW